MTNTDAPSSMDTPLLSFTMSYIGANAYYLSVY
jgi:hypothetical protein